MDSPSPSIPPSFPPSGPLVRPRVIRRGDAEPLPFLDHLQRLLDAGLTGYILVYGPPGSGKSTAIAAAEARFPGLVAATVRPQGRAPRLWITERRDPPRLPGWPAIFQLAPWTDDDLIEYLLAAWPQRVRGVMDRVLAWPHRAGLEGRPVLWRLILDALAADERLRDVDAALEAVLRRELGPRHYATAARVWARNLLAGCAPFPLRPHPGLDERLLTPRAVQWRLAAQHLLAEPHPDRLFVYNVPPELLDELTPLLKAAPAAQARFTWALRRPGAAAGLALSVLAAVDPACRRPVAHDLSLAKALVRGVSWRDLHVQQCLHCRFEDATLNFADFHGACLDGSTFLRVNFELGWFGRVRGRNVSFRGSHLFTAYLRAADLPGADFTAADLGHASLGASNLEEAIFERAYLGHADLRSCRLRQIRVAGANFQQATLDRAHLEWVTMTRATWRGASFRAATLSRCRLHGVDLGGCHCEQAIFDNCDLTAARARGTVFRGAWFGSCGLAEVDFENADLRDVDFTGSTFHMGSSRSGLVGSPRAGEGSRTGFYTDDFNDQDYRPPEEIRKANLCGADLRGARVDRTDFYLVDLRGARYTVEQHRHFQRCGAILNDRAAA